MFEDVYVLGRGFKKMNMRKIYFLLVTGLLCFSCTNKPKTQEKSDLTPIIIDTLSTGIDSSEEKETIKKVSTSFYEWYIKTTKADSDTTGAFSFIVVKGENEKCRVDFEPYFKQLRQLKTISKKFMDSEIERNKTCIEHMKLVDWKEYKNSEPYAYEDYCPDCSYMYWFHSQEAFDGVEIVHMTKKENIWYTTLRFYMDYQNKRTYYNSPQPIVKIENENGKWLTTEIKLK